MLVEGRHYFPNVDPQSLGHKVLAVNLSDLAAMGARPLGFTLAAGLRDLSQANRPWITAFTKGLFDLARTTQCACVGGDTVRVPASAPQVFSVTVIGAVPSGRGLKRSGVREGDEIWVSGRLGDAAFAVAEKISHEKLNWPQPQIALGLALLEIAHAAIDISDGLNSEVRHMLAASGQDLLADLHWQKIPLGATIQQAITSGRLSEEDARLLAAAGGDEYELCFTAPPSAHAAIEKIGLTLGVELTCIGNVRRAGQQLSNQIHWMLDQGVALPSALVQRLNQSGFDHFRS
jgi:thiamine-monophosphate kinase